jgi:catechol 2,3-dioxygenase-like lactoylglutathione lyase family enzyme
MKHSFVTLRLVPAPPRFRLGTSIQEKPTMSTIFESVSLHVADVEKSVAFYSKLPGAQLVMHRTGQFAKFKFGGGHIQVVGIPAQEKSFHIELDAPDLHALYEQLKSAGLEPESAPTVQSFGRAQFRIHDPDGNILEFDMV